MRVTQTLFPVIVDYGQSHEKMLEAGKFDWIDDYDNKLIQKNPTEHLIPVPSGVIEQRIELVPLDHWYMKTEEVLAAIEKLKLRPTMSTETLAFLAAHPEVQRKLPVIGLGSVWVDSRGHRLVLSAWEYSGRRHLCLPWLAHGHEHEWFGHCRFLAVRK